MKTDKSGIFDLVLERVALRPGSVLPEPDTLTVTIFGVDLRSATSPPARDSVMVVVSFTPPEAPAPITTVSLIMRTP